MYDIARPEGVGRALKKIESNGDDDSTVTAAADADHGAYYTYGRYYILYVWYYYIRMCVGKMNIKAWCPSQLCGGETLTPQFRKNKIEKGCARTHCAYICIFVYVYEYDNKVAVPYARVYGLGMYRVPDQVPMCL